MNRLKPYTSKKKASLALYESTGELKPTCSLVTPDLKGKQLLVPLNSPPACSVSPEPTLAKLLFPTQADGGMHAEELCTTAERSRALICVARCTPHIPALLLLLSNNHTVGVGVGAGYVGGVNAFIQGLQRKRPPVLRKWRLR